ERHFFLAVRNIQVTARLRIAVYGVDQALPVIEAFVYFRIQPLGDVQPPALYPLRTIQPARSILALAAIAAGATPYHAVGFQYHCLHTVLLGQVQRRNQTGKARPDDHDVGIEILRDGTIVFGRRARGADPISGRVGLTAASLADQRIVQGIVS